MIIDAVVFSYAFTAITNLTLVLRKNMQFLELRRLKHHALEVIKNLDLIKVNQGLVSGLESVMQDPEVVLGEHFDSLLPAHRLLDVGFKSCLRED